MGSRPENVERPDSVHWRASMTTGAVAPGLKLAFLGWGDHVHVERWATGLFRLGHEVTVISVSGLGNYPPVIRQYRVGLETGRPLLRLLRLAWLLRRIRPDVLHVHWAHFADLALGVWSGPLV